MLSPTAAETLAEDLIYQFAAPPRWGHPAHLPCFAARMSGLAVSPDNGQTWNDALESLGLAEPLPILAVAVAPNFAQGPTVWAGYNGGLLRSADGGAHWQNVTFPAPSPAICALTPSPNYANDGLLFAGSLEDGLFYSSDRGAHWQTGNFGLIDQNILCLGLSPEFASDRTLFAGTQSGLFCSFNAGRSWREVALPVGYEAVLSLALSPGYGKDGTLFAGTETQGLLGTTDWGKSWRRVGQAALRGSINHLSLSPGFPNEPHLLVLHEGEIVGSQDGGKTWQRRGQAALEDKTVTALFAPRGFAPGAAVLAGLEDGNTIRVLM